MWSAPPNHRQSNLNLQRAKTKKQKSAPFFLCIPFGKESKLPSHACSFCVLSSPRHVQKMSLSFSSSLVGDLSLLTTTSAMLQRGKGWLICYASPIPASIQIQNPKIKNLPLLNKPVLGRLCASAEDVAPVDPSMSSSSLLT